MSTRSNTDGGEMKFPYYSGKATASPDEPQPLPVPNVRRRIDPAGYLPDDGLIDAVNVALLLGQPLLLTGEPGTGKTQLAYHLAWELGYPKPLKFETKSTSISRDLFYTYDTVGRFQAGDDVKPAREYIFYQALGEAILRAKKFEEVKDFLPTHFNHQEATRSIVLIDEIDKAPRDFPNDILNEVEEMYFRIMELGNVPISAEEENRPIMILTSNSEKHLPDAFLRRCVFYHIPFPKADRMTEIVAARLGQNIGSGNQFVTDAIEFFYELRKPATGMRKRPSTAELLNWLQTLETMAPDSENPLRESALSTVSVDKIAGTVNCLAKTEADQNLVKPMLKDHVSQLRGTA